MSSKSSNNSKKKRKITEENTSKKKSKKTVIEPSDELCKAINSKGKECKLLKSGCRFHNKGKKKDETKKKEKSESNESNENESSEDEYEDSSDEHYMKPNPLIEYFKRLMLKYFSNNQNNLQSKPIFNNNTIQTNNKEMNQNNYNYPHPYFNPYALLTDNNNNNTLQTNNKEMNQNNSATYTNPYQSPNYQPNNTNPYSSPYNAFPIQSYPYHPSNLSPFHPQSPKHNPNQQPSQQNQSPFRQPHETQHPNNFPNQSQSNLVPNQPNFIPNQPQQLYPTQQPYQHQQTQNNTNVPNQPVSPFPYYHQNYSNQSPSSLHTPNFDLSNTPLFPQNISPLKQNTSFELSKYDRYPIPLPNPNDFLNISGDSVNNHPSPKTVHPKSGQNKVHELIVPVNNEPSQQVNVSENED